jgi:cytochrome c-type biogenesis protein CcmH/NrfG
MNRIVILDTNVLLADPQAVLSFPRAEVVIPETVLGELDKLKTARVDPDLRFRGREVSRLLFDLSEDGSLVDGVDLPDGGRMKVATLDGEFALPDGFSTRNSDDKILATAYQVSKSADSDTQVTLVTNDLNMLLKAQTLGIAVDRHGDGTEGGFARRFIIRPFQRYKVPIAILAVALAVFAAVIAISVYNQRSGISVGSLPPEFKSLLTGPQQAAFDALSTLQRNPEDPEALLAMGNFYFTQTETARQAGDRASQIEFSKQGVRYYDRYLQRVPKDNDARADMASLLFYSGQTDRAIQEVARVLESDPNHVNANFNLGIFYLQGRHDLEAAADQMRKVIKLAQNDPNQHAAYSSAQVLLKQIEQDLKSKEATQGVVQ